MSSFKRKSRCARYRISLKILEMAGQNLHNDFKPRAVNRTYYASNLVKGQYTGRGNPGLKPKDSAFLRSLSCRGAGNCDSPRMGKPEPGIKRLHRNGVSRVGAPGIEPGTSCTPCKRASRTAPRPVNLSPGSLPGEQGGIIAGFLESGNQDKKILIKRSPRGALSSIKGFLREPL